MIGDDVIHYQLSPYDIVGEALDVYIENNSLWSIEDAVDAAVYRPVRDRTTRWSWGPVTRALEALIPREIAEVTSV